MGNFLTDGRAALLAALQGDAEIAGRVKTWFEFGPGLQRRFNVEPSACPLLALSPADGDAVRLSNQALDVVQRLRIEVATDGQDAGPCEELVALLISRLRACDEDLLGLASDGLTGIDVEGISWETQPQPAGARLVWTARVGVALLWKRL
jgi:hypothetical protein